MRLYIARHGEAGSASRDDLRELTDAGTLNSREVYSRLAERIEPPVASIVASPLVRAQQTAAIARQHLPNNGAAVLTAVELRPESTPEAIVNMLDSMSDWPVMLVGHQPVLGELLCWLTDEPCHRYSVATSSLYALDLDAPAQGCATLVWNS